MNAACGNVERATTGVVTLDSSVLLFACFLAGALACQRFLYPFFFAGFQVEGVTFYFFNNVLRLHFPLEATQGVFERLAFLQSDFCQETTPPNRSFLDSLVIAR